LTTVFTAPPAEMRVELLLVVEIERGGSEVE
jgi:hypothetical protein